MGVLLAVIDDLWRFSLLWCLRGVRFFYPVFTEGQRTVGFDEGIREKKQRRLVSYEGAGLVHYIGAPHVDVYLHPAIEFDAVCGTLLYGEAVRLVGYEGRWAHVRYRGHEGWIFKDALRAEAKDVFPSFQIGTYYPADDAETKKLRSCIKDEFHAAEAGLPLSDAEFAMYQLWRKGKRIAWGTMRPRFSGSWQRLLKGVRGIHMSVHPHAESVMEYIADDIGHLAYVDAVFPDQGISLKAFSTRSLGMYEELSMSKDEWRELRPVFIEVL